jgi:hypothetical protein
MLYKKITFVLFLGIIFSFGAGNVNAATCGAGGSTYNTGTCRCGASGKVSQCTANGWIPVANIQTVCGGETSSNIVNLGSYNGQGSCTPATLVRPVYYCPVEVPTALDDVTGESYIYTTRIKNTDVDPGTSGWFGPFLNNIQIYGTNTDQVSETGILSETEDPVTLGESKSCFWQASVEIEQNNTSEWLPSGTTNYSYPSRVPVSLIQSGGTTNSEGTVLPQAQVVRMNLTWDPIPGAVYYDLYIGENESQVANSVGTSWLNQSGIEETTAMITVPTGRTFWWKVVGYDQNENAIPMLNPLIEPVYEGRVNGFTGPLFRMLGGLQVGPTTTVSGQTYHKYITWSPIYGAEYYRISRAGSSGGALTMSPTHISESDPSDPLRAEKQSIPGVQSNTSILPTGSFGSGVYSEWKVTGYDANGNELLSEPPVWGGVFSSPYLPVEAPKQDVTWPANTIAGVAYKVYLSVNGEDFSYNEPEGASVPDLRFRLSGLRPNAYTFKHLDFNTKYFVRVEAKKENNVLSAYECSFTTNAEPSTTGSTGATGGMTGFIEELSSRTGSESNVIECNTAASIEGNTGESSGVTTFFGTILNPIRDFFIQIAINVREFSNRTDLPHVRTEAIGTTKNPPSQEGDEKRRLRWGSDGTCLTYNWDTLHWESAGSNAPCEYAEANGFAVEDDGSAIDDDLSSFSVFPGNNNDIIDDDLSSFKYGDTECDITISAGGLTQAQKTEIKACLLDPTLLISSEEKNTLLQMLNK